MKSSRSPPRAAQKRRASNAGSAQSGWLACRVSSPQHGICSATEAGDLAGSHWPLSNSDAVEQLGPSAIARSAIARREFCHRFVFERTPEAEESKPAPNLQEAVLRVERACRAKGYNGRHCFTGPHDRTTR
eukprot:scaffold78343_cov63-Phaeocystis_antarctica.AAC.1